MNKFRLPYDEPARDPQEMSDFVPAESDDSSFASGVTMTKINLNKLSGVIDDFDDDDCDDMFFQYPVFF